jgi:hypothetical protein
MFLLNGRGGESRVIKDLLGLGMEVHRRKKNDVQMVE